MMNAQWSKQNGYVHQTYCVSRCAARPSMPLSAAWCKLPVLLDALQSNQFDTVLYLDSDAFWNSTGNALSVISRFMWPGDWNAPIDGGGSIFFGCNAPWNGEDRGRRQWNRSWENGGRGPPNTGVMLLRHDAAAMTTLAAWWRAPLHITRWNQKHQWEQSALWELWHTQAGFAKPLRVFSDPASGDCMRTMDRRRPSIIAHVPGGGRPSLKQRNAFFQGTTLAQKVPWTTQFTRIDAGSRSSGGAVRSCTQVLTASPGRAGMQLSPCTF